MKALKNQSHLCVRILEHSISLHYFLIVCAVLAFFSVLGGCGKKETPHEENASKKYRIAFASFGPDDAADNAIKGYLDGLASEGFVEGENLEVLRKHAFGEISHLPQLMKALDDQDLDLIVPMSTPGLAAAFASVKMTPMVFVYTYDPLGAGAGKSLDDHIPNATGVASFPPIADTMDVILRTFPETRKIGTIYNASESNSVKAVSLARKILQAKNIGLEEMTVSSPADVITATKAVLSKNVDAVWITGDNTVLQSLEGVIAPCNASGIPLIINDPEFVDRGALIGVGIGWHQSGFEAGKIAARVLRGESPAKIPILEIAKKRLAINHKLAERMKINLPADLEKN